jgi:hypothetical protein
VVADAGMLSAANLADLDEAGLGFIVGSRVTKAPVDLESHFRWHGDAFSDGQVIDTVTPKTGKNVFTALAVAGAAQDRTGLAIRNVIRQLRPLRSATIAINGAVQTFPPAIGPEQQKILDDLRH